MAAHPMMSSQGRITVTKVHVTPNTDYRKTKAGPGRPQSAPCFTPAERKLISFSDRNSRLAAKRSEVILLADNRVQQRVISATVAD
ncbi:hypothetical protein J6590_036794 [Homalodisca vitripennis]|nr:hypothetical protein J6590_036794 [Homalodisca vitripennis]